MGPPLSVVAAAAIVVVVVHRQECLAVVLSLIYDISHSHRLNVEVLAIM